MGKPIVAKFVEPRVDLLEVRFGKRVKAERTMRREAPRRQAVGGEVGVFFGGRGICLDLMSCYLA